MIRRSPAFDDFVDEQMKRPSFTAEHERARVEVRAVDELLRTIDARREGLGMTKADLARRISSSPEAIRRLLTSNDANPTFRTVLDVLDAVGLAITIAPVGRTKAKRAKKNLP